MLKVKFRIDNLEFRTCDCNLLQRGPHTKAEIVKWKTGTCYTILHWEPDTYGFNIKFCGDRVFDKEVDESVLFMLLKTGQECLERFKDAQSKFQNE